MNKNSSRLLATSAVPSGIIARTYQLQVLAEDGSHLITVRDRMYEIEVK